MDELPDAGLQNHARPVEHGAEEMHQFVSELSPLDLAALDLLVRGNGARSHYSLHLWRAGFAEIQRIIRQEEPTRLFALDSNPFRPLFAASWIGSLLSR